MKGIEEGYDALRNAVVLQAIKDYRKALKKLKSRRRNVLAESTVKEVEEFFRSGRFSLFTEVDGEMLIKRLREEAHL